MLVYLLLLPPLALSSTISVLTCKFCPLNSTCVPPPPSSYGGFMGHRCECDEGTISTSSITVQTLVDLPPRDFLEAWKHGCMSELSAFLDPENHLFNHPISFPLIETEDGIRPSMFTLDENWDRVRFTPYNYDENATFVDVDLNIAFNKCHESQQAYADDVARLTKKVHLFFQRFTKDLFSEGDVENAIESGGKVSTQAPSSRSLTCANCIGVIEDYKSTYQPSESARRMRAELMGLCYKCSGCVITCRKVMSDLENIRLLQASFMEPNNNPHISCISIKMCSPLDYDIFLRRNHEGESFSYDLPSDFHERLRNYYKNAKGVEENNSTSIGMVP